MPGYPMSPADVLNFLQQRGQGGQQVPRPNDPELDLEGQLLAQPGRPGRPGQVPGPAWLQPPENHPANQPAPPGNVPDYSNYSPPATGGGPVVPPMPVQSPAPAPVPPALQTPAQPTPATQRPRPAQANSALTSPSGPNVSPAQVASLVGGAVPGGMPLPPGLPSIPPAVLSADPSTQMQITNGTTTNTYGFNGPTAMQGPTTQLLRQQVGTGIPANSLVTGGRMPPLPTFGGGQGDVGMGMPGMPDLRDFARNFGAGLGGIPTPEAMAQASPLYTALANARSGAMTAQSGALQAGAQYLPGGLAFQAQGTAQQAENRLTAQAQHGMETERVWEAQLAAMQARGASAQEIQQARANFMRYNRNTSAPPQIAQSPYAGSGGGGGGFVGGGGFQVPSAVNGPGGGNGRTPPGGNGRTPPLPPDPFEVVESPPVWNAIQHILDPAARFPTIQGVAGPGGTPRSDTGQRPGAGIGEFLSRLNSSQSPGFVQQNLPAIRAYVIDHWGQQAWDLAAQGLQPGNIPFTTLPLGERGQMPYGYYGWGDTTGMSIFPRALAALRQRFGTGHTEEESGRAALAALLRTIRGGQQGQ